SRDAAPQTARSAKGTRTMPPTTHAPKTPSPLQARQETPATATPPTAPSDTPAQSSGILFGVVGNKISRSPPRASAAPRPEAAIPTREGDNQQRERGGVRWVVESLIMWVLLWPNSNHARQSARLDECDNDRRTWRASAGTFLPSAGRTRLPCSAP